VNKSEVSTEGTIGELARETDDEVLLILELCLRDGARAIEDNSNVDRLTALAAGGGREDRASRSAGGEGLEGKLTKISVDGTADTLIGLIPIKGGDVTGGASNAVVLSAGDTIDRGRGGSPGEVGADGRVNEELAHGSVKGTGLASASPS